MDNRERARVRNKKKTETNFVGGKNKKIKRGGEKMSKASGFQGEMSCSEKTVIGNTNISSIKRVTRKLKEVPRLRRAKQRQ